MTEGILVWIQERTGGAPLLNLCYPIRADTDEVACDLQKIDLPLLERMRSGDLQPDVVKQVGLLLTQCLREHAAIKRELAAVLQSQGPIYLRLDTAAADDLPWEAMHDDNQGFLAFNQGWPIARVKKVRKAVMPEAVFAPPLKIYAVMAPTNPNVAVEPEWEALYDAARSSNLNLKLRVLVCNDKLKAQIEALPEFGPKGWIECEFVTTQTELFDDIARFQPHILHFLCHGLASAPSFLQAGNRIDFKLNQTGTVTIEATQLRQRADPKQNAWLVTLDCCETAAQGVGIGSRSRPFASSLVLEGFPAVVGMRERVGQDVAARFCGVFYKRLLNDLRTSFEKARQTQKPSGLNWGDALFAARQEICQSANPQLSLSAAAPSNKDWTIPVLYTRTDEFTIKVLPDPTGESPITRPAAAAPQPVNPPAPAAAAAPQPVNPPAPSALTAKIQTLEQFILLRQSLAGNNPTLLAELDAKIEQLKKEVGL